MILPELFILRHGETTWNAEGRFQGALDSPLTPLGQLQAERQAVILQGFDVTSFSVYSSPLGRATETARIATGAISPKPEMDERLREIDMGDWTGKLRRELTIEERTLPDGRSDPVAIYAQNPTAEPFVTLRRRCADFLSDLSGPAILVTHGVTSRMLRALILGMKDTELGQLQGGQGVIYHLHNGVQKRLS